MYTRMSIVIISITVLVVGLTACSSEAIDAFAEYGNSGSSIPPADQSGPVGEPAGSGSQPGGMGLQPMVDMVTAAAQLGVTEEALVTALGDPGQGPPDFATAAAALGVTEADLMATLGIAEDGMPPGGQPPANRP